MLTRTLIILLLTSYMGFTQPTRDNAGIFSTETVPPLKPLIISLAPNAKISEGRAGDMNTLSCEWPDVTVIFTIDPHWNRSIQCSGMKGWISRFPAEQQNTMEVSNLLQKIDATVDCVGSVISPEYDSNGKAAALILGVATRLNGFVFSYQSFYDTNGVKIIGLPDSPTKLQHSKQ